MLVFRRAGGGASGVGLVISLCVALSACVAGGPPRAQKQAVANLQPRFATYDCGEKGLITVENTRTAVRLTEPEGQMYDLMAAPPTQASRYDADGMALVLEGRDALWMKAGSEPVDCRR